MMRFSGSRFAGSHGPVATPYRQFGTGIDRGRGYPRQPRDWDRDRDRHHDRDHHHRMVYWNGGIYPYGYFYPGYPIFTGYVDPWLFGPDDYSSDQDQPAANYGSAGGYDPGGNYNEDASGDPQSPYAPDPGYAGQYGLQQPANSQDQVPAQSAPARQPSAVRQPYTGSNPATAQGSQSVTVIFKDGRPAEHFHNYLLTGNTLTVYEPHYRQIPLDELDLTATEAANQEAGVDFRPPGQ